MNGCSASIFKGQADEEGGPLENSILTKRHDEAVIVMETVVGCRLWETTFHIFIATDTALTLNAVYEVLRQLSFSSSQEELFWSARPQI